jgi:hypothetical protein
MLSNAEKSALLNKAVDMLNEADALVQQALGDSDVTWETHIAIQSIADDIVSDIIEFDMYASEERCQ